MRGKILPVLIIMLFVGGIVAILLFILNANNTIGGITNQVPPTITVTPTPNIPKVNFSGFNGNVSLQSIDAAASQVQNLPTSSPVYFANPVDVSYMTEKLGLKTNTNLNVLENTDFILQQSPSQYTLTSTHPLVKGGDSIASLEAIFTSFYTKALGLDGSLLSLTYSQTEGDRVFFTLNQKINKGNVYLANTNPGASVTMSTSGQILYIAIYSLFYNLKSQDIYPLAFPQTSDTSGYVFGTYIPGVSQSNTSGLVSVSDQTDQVQNYQFGYYFDAFTNNIIPVEKLTVNIGTINGTTYQNVSVLVNLLAAQNINAVSAPASSGSYLNGYSQQ